MLSICILHQFWKIFSRFSFDSFYSTISNILCMRNCFFFNLYWTFPFYFLYVLIFNVLCIFSFSEMYSLLFYLVPIPIHLFRSNVLEHIHCNFTGSLIYMSFFILSFICHSHNFLNFFNHLNVVFHFVILLS